MSNVRNVAVVLLSNASATGQPVTVPGGQYVWAAQGTFSGATLTLQALGPDGANYIDVTTLSANGAIDVRIGQDTAMRVSVSGGAPSAIYSNLKGVL